MAKDRVDAWRMIKRRAAGLGMKVRSGCPTFRAIGITAYLEAAGTLEQPQEMRTHESRGRSSMMERRNGSRRMELTGLDL